MAGPKAMISLLDASEPYKEYGDELMTFGQFVGSWDIEATYFDHGGRVLITLRGEWHFGWVLEGRAIQDVFITPSREERRAGKPAREYGSSLRMYDARSKTWRVTWFAPVSGAAVDLRARRAGDEIVLEGREAAGALHRWVFSDIESDSFVWQGFESKDGGGTWPLVQRMLARRYESL
jgi:hypothetical protein